MISRVEHNYEVVRLRSLVVDVVPVLDAPAAAVLDMALLRIGSLVVAPSIVLPLTRNRFSTLLTPDRLSAMSSARRFALRSAEDP